MATARLFTLVAAHVLLPSLACVPHPAMLSSHAMGNERSILSPEAELVDEL